MERLAVCKRNSLVVVVVGWDAGELAAVMVWDVGNPGGAKVADGDFISGRWRHFLLVFFLGLAVSVWVSRLGPFFLSQSVSVCVCVSVCVSLCVSVCVCVYLLPPRVAVCREKRSEEKRRGGGGGGGGIVRVLCGCCLAPGIFPKWNLV